MAYIGKSPTGTGIRQRYYFTATGGETSLSGTDDNGLTMSYADGAYVDVNLNGIKLVSGTDYTTTTANTIGGLAALSANDIVEVVAYDIFTVADTVSAKNGGTFNGNVTTTGNISAVDGSFSGDISVTGDLTVDTNTLHVDSTNNRVGIGTSSPIGKLMVKDGTSSPSALVVRQTSEGAAAALSLDSIFNNANNTDKEIASIKLGVVTNGSATPSAEIRFETAHNGTLSEAMRITSAGTILLGKTDTLGTSAGFQFHKNAHGYGAAFSAPVLYLNRNTTNGTNLQFRMNNSPVGAVNVTATSTSYATSSDYRLKENVTDMTGATDRLKQLNPVRFNFIVDADTTVDGFLAHEVQSVVPEAITGTHNEVDADGNPEYQGIDQSKLVPLLVATIQELEARISELEAN